MDSNNGTWDFWVKTTQTGGFIGLVGKHDGTNSSNNGITMEMDQGLPRMEVKANGPTALLVGTTRINDGQFHHLALTFVSGGATNLYVDGQLQATATAPAFNFNPNPLRFGRMQDQFWTPFKGILDQLQVYNRPLSAAEIQAIVSNPSGTTPAGLVSWWADGNTPTTVPTTGPTTSPDIGGTNPGTLNGGVTFTPGKVGSGFNFDGSRGSFVNIADAPSLDSTTGTWNFWLKTTQTGGFIGLVGKHDAASSLHGITMQLDQGHARIEVKGTATTLLTGTTTLNDGQWHNMALTFQSGGPAIMYIDGRVQVSGTAPDFSFNATPLRFGSMLDTFWTPYNGQLDEVQVFGRVLSPDEIQAIYNAGSAGEVKGVTALDPTVVPTGGFSVGSVAGTSSGLQTVATFTDPGGSEHGQLRRDDRLGRQHRPDDGDDLRPRRQRRLHGPGCDYATVGNPTITVTIHHDTANPDATATGHALVSATAANVASVSVSWGSAGSSALLTAADGLRLLPAGRNTDLPWLGISNISIALSQPGVLTSGDVTVTSAAGIAYGPVTVSGSGTSYVITLAQPISSADRVTLTIGSASIATFTRRLDVLPGDVNDDGVVTLGDAILVRNEYLSFAPVAIPVIFLDIDGNGIVDVNDYNHVRRRIGTAYPEPGALRVGPETGTRFSGLRSPRTPFDSITLTWPTGRGVSMMSVNHLVSASIREGSAHIRPAVICTLLALATLVLDVLSAPAACCHDHAGSELEHRCRRGVRSTSFSPTRGGSFK